MEEEKVLVEEPKKEEVSKEEIALEEKRKSRNRLFFLFIGLDVALLAWIIVLVAKIFVETLSKLG